MPNTSKPDLSLPHNPLSLSYMRERCIRYMAITSAALPPKFPLTRPLTRCIVYPCLGIDPGLIAGDTTMSNMRPENASMQAFLSTHGIKCAVKYLDKGSLKGNWRLYGKGQVWVGPLWESLSSLGFINFDGQSLDCYSGNGGTFSVFVAVAEGTPAHAASSTAINAAMVAVS